jgi:cysteine synthase A
MVFPSLATTTLMPLKSFPGVWLKCEHENPTGSHKDRAYAAMVRSIQKTSAPLTIVDYTTGNGGISLAWVARSIGASAVAFMPVNMSSQRATLIRSLGAELVLTPEEGFVGTARAAAEEFVRAHANAVLLNQSDNLANEWAFVEVGVQLVTQLESCRARPAAFVCAIGTGGTFSGIGRVLKAHFGEHSLSCIGIEVPEAPVLWSKRRGMTVVPRVPSIVGMGAGKIARNTDERLIDDVRLVGAPDIGGICRALQAIDHLEVGPSTAANVLVASQVAKEIGKDVVTVSFDRADRYDPFSRGAP